MPEAIMNEEVVENATEAVANAGFGLKEAGIAGGIAAGVILLGVGITKFVKKGAPKAKKAIAQFQQNRKDKKDGKYVKATVIEK